MNSLRIVYRNAFVETIILLSVLLQIVSGLYLFKKQKRTVTKSFDKLQIWTGLYLAFFFLVHVGAVFTGRFILNLDTNFYFGVAGMNSFPFSLFFIPYYAMAIFSFFTHIACIHYKKMERNIAGLSPWHQSIAVMIAGLVIMLLVLYGSTGEFNGVEVPEAYKVLQGK
ncbi:hypothetical protein [Pseudoflavitalea rhizosphaerae]|uniref:hypothetical protein n=1 Tax=Pseudoflavitalea rhizosphaerae TaxID=1884793 RepID=UPI0019CF9F1F|nr:hypothetical protein [Pseudoflavitalea rhizosphaerae]